MKDLRLEKIARQEAVSALRVVADAVGTSLGPSGLPFIFEKQNSIDGKPSPMVTKDGLTILKSLSFVEPVNNAVHQFCVQASSHTVFSAGDGTTSTIVLASEIANYIANSASNNPQKFARELQKKADKAIDCIKKEAVKSPEMAKISALTASNGDEEMVDWVMKAVEKNPSFGSIIIERNPATKERYQVVQQEGVTAGKGYNQFLQLAHSVSEKTSENSPFELENPIVICYDGDLITQSQIAPIINGLHNFVSGHKINLMILAYELSQEVVNVLTSINARNLGLKVWASGIRLTAESNGSWHKLQDVASFTGATIVNAGTDIEKMVSCLGDCRKIVVTPEKTIFSGKSENHYIPKRVLQNQNAIECAVTELDKDRIRERNAELTNGITKLIVGGGHLPNIQERADRCDDAIRAAQACLVSGALPGCGASYIRAAYLADFDDSLKAVFATIHKKIMNNYGEKPKTYFNEGETICIGDTVSSGNFVELKIADSTETVVSVIKNAIELAVTVTTLGGYSLTSDLEELEKIQRVRAVMQ